MVKKYLRGLIERAGSQNHKNIQSLLPKKKQALFLDLGCDDGEVTALMASSIGTTRMFGIEVVPKRIALAKKRGVQVKNADLNKRFPYKNNTFDIVHSNQVIEHLVDTDNFISEIYRVLKPNGTAVISTENLSSWHNIVALLFGFQPFSMTNFSSKGNIGNPFALWNDTVTSNSTIKSWQHTRLFSYFALKDVFEKHGFIVEKIVTSGYYPLWGSLSSLDPIHGHWIAIKAVKR